MIQISVLKGVEKTVSSYGGTVLDSHTSRCVHAGPKQGHGGAVVAMYEFHTAGHCVACRQESAVCT